MEATEGDLLIPDLNFNTTREGPSMSLKEKESSSKDNNDPSSQAVSPPVEKSIQASTDDYETGILSLAEKFSYCLEKVYDAKLRLTRVYDSIRTGEEDWKKAKRDGNDMGIPKTDEELDGEFEDELKNDIKDNIKEALKTLGEIEVMMV